MKLLRITMELYLCLNVCPGHFIISSACKSLLPSLQLSTEVLYVIPYAPVSNLGLTFSEHRGHFLD